MPPILDFDGDGKTDYVAIEPTKDRLTWHIQQSSAGYVSLMFGKSGITDVAVPADYDGDGKCDVAIWRRGVMGEPSHFWILNSQTNNLTVIPWGRTTDNPRATQDFDGDLKADPTVIRRENGKLVWWTLFSTGGFSSMEFGLDTDFFLRGDYDGDGKADHAVYRGVPWESNPPYMFISRNSLDGNVRFTRFGFQMDFLIPADFDGDGKTDVAVYRYLGYNGADNAVWHWIQSSDGSYQSVKFGLAAGTVQSVTDYAIPGDYDGDGKTDLAVWRTSTNDKFQTEFHVLGSAVNYSMFPWGSNKMIILNHDLQVVTTFHPQ